ncbi:MAG: magnesium/cobalt transporter CorA [Deltaproteobacteria bacterium]|nr:magnesium/cobalt transporter CorA [Deltaproteobacteria bacterium]
MGKKRSRKLGLPPGSLIYLGEKTDQKLRITVLEYNENELRESELPSFDACPVFRPSPTVTWLNIDGLQHIEDIKTLGQCLGLHPLVLEDILSTDQRPKVDDYGDYIYLVLRLLRLQNHSGLMTSEQLSLVVGDNYVISLRDSDGDLFAPIRERLRAARGRVRKEGADYLAYALLDLVVDNYFLILEDLGETIENLEEELVAKPTRTTLTKIHRLKRDLIVLRRAVWPLREVMSRLERRESPIFKEGVYLYLKDVYDHVIQVIDTIETFREMVSGMLDIYLSSVSNRLNEIMKVLTIIATIFIPLTFVAGVYGMNFKHMPELDHPYGYFTVLGLMVGIGLFMLFLFWRRGWLSRRETEYPSPADRKPESRSAD